MGKISLKSLSALIYDFPDYECLWVRPELIRVKHPSSAALLGRHLTFLTDIRLGW